MTQSNSKVSIVGAGPGDPDLLTIKAYKAIKSANVILYDALVSDEIINIAPLDAVKIYVGKRSSNHAFSQDEINEMLVANALIYGHVVRLKGGDPFVFGSGGEALDYVRQAGIDLEIIPGISSFIGVPGRVGIPVTHRGLSESFWVLTATDKNGNLSKDIQKAVSIDSTVVVLMGLQKLLQITQLFSENGKDNVPVAIIQNGTLKSQKIVTGTISDIFEKSNSENLKAPAIIIIGEVVRLYQPSILVEQYQTILA